MIAEASSLEDPVLLSALEHYSYCPRQCALIHREQIYDENVFTLQGNAVHKRVDQPGTATVDGIKSEYSVALWSEVLGVVGRADLVEFRNGVPYPVEYKHGPAGHGRHADLQLCGQGMCLEEMLGIPVPQGAVYHFSSRQRREVAFTAELRRSVELAVADIRRMMRSDRLPAPVADSRCRNCSLIDSCLPFVVSDQSRGLEYQNNLFRCDQS